MKQKNIRTVESGREYTTRIIAVFGDISGFGEWFDSMSDQESELKPFMRKFDEEIDIFEDQSQYFVKRTGDGFMIILELKTGDNGDEVASLLIRLMTMQLNVRNLIDRQKYPRPAGFRIRVTSGFAWRKVHRGRMDYIAKSINLSSKLLRVGKTVPFIIHESVKDFIPLHVINKFFLKFERTIIGSSFPDGVYQKDMDSLWSLKIGEKKKK